MPPGRTVFQTRVVCQAATRCETDGVDFLCQLTLLSDQHSHVCPNLSRAWHMSLFEGNFRVGPFQLREQIVLLAQEYIVYGQSRRTPDAEEALVF